MRTNEISSLKLRSDTSHTYSDHYPLLLQLEGQAISKLGERSFRFQEAWFLEKRFPPLIKNRWKQNEDMLQSLDKLTDKIRTWNNEVFGNIFQHKRNLLSMLDSVQWELARHASTALLKFERKLKGCLNDTPQQEEVLWQ